MKTVGSVRVLHPDPVPKMAPPVKGDEGSTARTATWSTGSAGAGPAGARWGRWRAPGSLATAGHRAGPGYQPVGQGRLAGPGSPVSPTVYGGGRR